MSQKSQGRPVDPKSEGARAGRALVRATWGTPLSALALLTAFWIPLLAIASALGSLIGLALLVSRMLRQKQIVAEEVSSLRHLGSGRRGATPSRRP